MKRKEGRRMRERERKRSNFPEKSQMLVFQGTQSQAPAEGWQLARRELLRVVNFLP